MSGLEDELILDTSLAFMERWGNNMMEEATALLRRRSLLAVFAPLRNSIMLGSALHWLRPHPRDRLLPGDSVRCEQMKTGPPFAVCSQFLNTDPVTVLTAVTTLSGIILTAECVNAKVF